MAKTASNLVLMKKRHCHSKSEKSSNFWGVELCSEHFKEMWIVHCNMDNLIAISCSYTSSHNPGAKIKMLKSQQKGGKLQRSSLWSCALANFLLMVMSVVDVDVVFIFLHTTGLYCLSIIVPYKKG